MENYNPYDERFAWSPGQEHTVGKFRPDQTYGTLYQPQTQAYYTGDHAYAQSSSQRERGAKLTQAAPRPPARMSKAQAVEMAQSLKRGIAVSSIAGFVALSVLVATHLQATAASQSTSSSASPNTPSNSNANQNTNDDGGFFHHRRGDQQSGNQQGGGYGFGNGNGGSIQSPSTGSSVS